MNVPPVPLAGVHEGSEGDTKDTEDAKSIPLPADGDRRPSAEKALGWVPAVQRVQAR